MNRPNPLKRLAFAMAFAGVSAVAVAETFAGDTPAPPRAEVGSPVDIAPWAYPWRADREVQVPAEVYFIPRRLERLDRVYRTARTALSASELKSLYYDMPDILKTFPPPPKGRLLAGLLWTGGLSRYRVEICWPADARDVPKPGDVEVRTYPTSFGWFGWTVDRALPAPTVSADGRTWTYRSDPAVPMDWAYSRHVDAATEMIAVFAPAAGAKPVVPQIRVLDADVGAWKAVSVEIEWGFQPGTESAEFDGRLETHVAVAGPVTPLDGDRGTTLSETGAWRSHAAGSARRGVVVPLRIASGNRPGHESRVTVWTKDGGFTFRVRDLENGPILIPREGVFVTAAGRGETARQFARKTSEKALRSVRQMTREHREAASWEEVLREVRLWRCPPGSAIKPLPPVDDPPVQVTLPDARWSDAWRAASAQLKGRHMWGGLAFEVGRVAHEMNLVGLNAEADRVYEHFLKGPGAKSDGDYADGRGALEWATSLRHDIGYSHDGTHASTGRLLFAMSERYFLTGDREWFVKNRPRLQEAADWIVRQRNGYMKGIPGRESLAVAGLMPPCMLGDYALPACDWHWYYCDDAFSLQGLTRFAQALAEVDPAAARAYHDEAEAFRADLRRAVRREAVLAPVRRGRDGLYHHYVPRMAYTRGLSGPELNAPQFPDCDRFMGALPLAEPFSALDPGDPAMVDTLDVMEEMGTSEAAVRELEAGRRAKGLPTADAWFWTSYVMLPKASHNANVYLLQDDVPEFLRFWSNTAATIVGANGKFWEPWHPTDFADCTDPDNGTAGWFLENFRNLLVMEDGASLWIARGTPRAWLEPGKTIAVRNAPTYFGTLAYEITSDLDHGQIRATVDVPKRAAPKTVLLRLRHPAGKPLQSVIVNGHPWPAFDRAREVVELSGVTGTVKIVARYGS